MRYKKGEFVLVSNGEGAYRVKQVADIKNIKLILADGNFGFEYDVKDVHKCPKSISKEFVKKIIKEVK